MLRFRRAPTTPRPSNFAELYEHYFVDVFRRAKKLGLTAADAEDAAHDAFSLAYKRIDELAEVESIGGWMMSITLGVVLNRKRQLQKHIELHDMHASTDDSPQVLLERKEQQQAILAVLDGLPKEQAEVFWLSECEGWTQQEVADALGVPANTVASRLRLARARLQKHQSTNPTSLTLGAAT